MDHQMKHLLQESMELIDKCQEGHYEQERLEWNQKQEIFMNDLNHSLLEVHLKV
jgi:hypothetical protein